MNTYEYEILVLRIVDYSESSQIVTGFGAECGLVKFYSRGSRRLSKKNFPQIGLFRKLLVELEDGRGELKLLKHVSLLAMNDHLARNWTSYRFALSASAMLSHSLPEGMPQEELYLWLEAAWSERVQHKPLEAWNSGLALAYLNSQGLLSFAEYDTRQLELLQAALDLPCREEFAEEISAVVWSRLFLWTKSLLQYYDISWFDASEDA